MSLLHRLANAQSRSPAEIERDISSEIEFHLHMRTRDLIAQGLDPDQSRARAEQQFGDIPRIAHQCRIVQLGDRVMFQRILIGSVIVLLIALVTLGYATFRFHEAKAVETQTLRAALAAAQVRLDEAQSRADAIRPSVTPDTGERTSARFSPEGIEPPGELATLWRDRFAQQPMSREHGLRVATELAALPPEESLRIMTGIWADLSVAHREQVLQPFLDGGHPYAVKLLHLAASDATLSIKNRAFALLKAYAFRDFTDDQLGYLAWNASYADTPLDQLIPLNARAFLSRLQALDPAALLRELEAIDLDPALSERSGVDLPAILRESGAIALCEGWLTQGDPELQAKALEWARDIQPEQAWLREHAVSRLNQPGISDRVLYAACGALGQPGASWAQAPLSEFVVDRIRSYGNTAPSLGSADLPVIGAMNALVEIGDPAAIPQMIAMIVADPSGSAIYNVGHFGLAKLTGVSYDESHDGAWWVEWWNTNQSALPPEIRGSALPDFGK